MNIIPRATCLAVTMLCVVFTSPGMAESPGTVPAKSAKQVIVQDLWSLPGVLGGGLKTTDEYTEGNVFVVLPVYSTIGQGGRLGGDVLFIEPYSSWGEQGEVAASLGLGWRHLISDQSVTAITQHDGHQAGIFEEGVFLGANIFADMLNTEQDNQFWQAGFGVEAGSRYLEVRANYYLPLTDRKLASETRTTQTFSSSRTTTSQQVTPLGDPYATGHSISQDVNLTTLAHTTTSTTTIEQLFRLYEEGMEGWDVEASLLVPGLDRYMDVKLVGGYFSFDNAPLGPQTGGTGNVEGWKAGLEVRPVPAVVLTTTWYQDERFVGSEWLYGIRMELPFEMGDLADGKGGFWGRIKDAFTPRRRHLAERLVEPVRRQNDAVQTGNDLEEERTVSTDVKRVTKVISQGPQRIILQDDIIFVNHGGAVGNGIQAGSAAGDGTAERPVDQIQTGGIYAQANTLATQRIWNVYTQGNGVPYVQDVQVNAASVNFIGSGQPIQGLNGKTFGQGPAPFLSGGFLVDGNGGRVGFFGVSGYVITSEENRKVAVDGISVSNVARVVIRDNILLNNPSGISLATDGASAMDALVTGNTIVNSGGHSISASTSDSSRMTLAISRNSLQNIGFDGIHAEANDTSRMTLAVNDNVFRTAYEDYIDAQNFDSAFVTFSASGNAMHSAIGAALRLESHGTQTLAFDIRNNFMENGPFNGIELSSHDSSTLAGNIVGNTIVNQLADAVDLTSGDTSTLNVLKFDGNNLQPGTVLSRGVDLTEFAGSTLLFNGTLDNTVGAFLFGKLNSNGTSPAGKFLLNGASITLPADVP